MSEQPFAGDAPDPAGEAAGFFRAGQPLPADDVPSEVWESVDAFLNTHPGGQERLIPLLHQIQGQIGYLPFSVQEYVAEKLGMSPIQVYAVVSFYHFFTTTPRGKYQLKVCTGTACFVRRSQRIIDTINDALDLRVGAVTDDLRFSLEEVRCLGACGLAPALMVNNEVHGNMTPGETRKRLRLLGVSRGEHPEASDSRDSGD